MGSKSKKQNTTVNAYGANMSMAQKESIYSHNANEKQRGQTLDNNYSAQRAAIVQKDGTVDYKKYIRSHLKDLTSILGVK